MRHFPILVTAALVTLACQPGRTAETFVHEVAIAPGTEAPESILDKASRVVPAPRQLAFHRLEYTCFIHFGINTYTGVEWGSGKENAALFNPGDTLDTDQWCRTAKAAGMKLMLITVKHHDGFCLWQTRYNDTFSVRSIPWRAGNGDILRALADSCHKHGLKLGVYLSPADLYQLESATGLYGNGSTYQKTVIPTDPAHFRTEPTRVRADKPEGAPVFEVEADDYNRYFMNQLYELLTQYGPIHEVWFDGAHPKRKGGQTYIKEKWFHLIRTLAPEAVIFGGPDVRWCGNEAGKTRGAEWNVIPVQGLVESGADRPQPDIGSDAQLVKPGYEVYGEKFSSRFLYYILPEINTSIRAGWFWRNEHEQGVRTADDVFDIYERAAGGNGVFLLNVPPDKSGRFGPRDVASLEEAGRRIRETYGDAALMSGTLCDHAEVLDEHLDTYWQPGAPTGDLTVAFPEARTINRVVLQEAVGKVGQRVKEHALDARVGGAWREVARAETIGYKRILRFPAVTADALRVRLLASRGEPSLATVSAHLYRAPPPTLSITRDAKGLIVIAPPKAAAFGWKPHGQGDATTATGLAIHYTLDGTDPSAASPRYEGPFALPGGGLVKAVALVDGAAGAVSEARLPVPTTGWKIASVSSEHSPEYAGAKAIDGDPATYWHTDWSASPPHPHTLVIDFGRTLKVTGFTYLPRQDKAVPDSMVESGEVSLSADGATWGPPRLFHFGNLVNDPALRTVLFEGAAVEARYFRFVSKTGAAGKPYAGAADIGIFAAP